MKKTLTYLVFLLTMFVSVPALALQFCDLVDCSKTATQQCSESGIILHDRTGCVTGTSCNVYGGKSGQPDPKDELCVSSAYADKPYSCNSSGCTCKAGNSAFSNGTRITCQPVDENTCQSPKILNSTESGIYSCKDPETESTIGALVALIIGAAAAAAVAAVTCSAGAVAACVGSAATAFGFAGIIVSALVSDGTAPSPQANSAGGNALTVSLGGGAPSSSYGVHRDDKGNLTATGAGWTTSGDTKTQTQSAGGISQTTTVDTKADTATHTTTNTNTGKTTTTVITGSGSKSGGGTSMTAVTEGNTTTYTGVHFNPSGTPTDVNVTVCQGSTCTVSTPTAGGGSTGGGSTGGGSTGGGDTGGSPGGSTGGGATGDCPECEILTNILKTLKGEGTDGDAALAGIEESLDDGIANATQAFDQGYQALLDGLPIEDMLSEMGLNPFEHMQDNASCSLDVNILGFHNVLTYCPYQDQIHGALAFFFFLLFLTGVRDIVFERPYE